MGMCNLYILNIGYLRMSDAASQNAGVLLSYVFPEWATVKYSTLD